MPDNAQLAGAADRSRVAAGEPKRIVDSAQKDGLRHERVPAPTEGGGDDQAKLDAAAEGERAAASTRPAAAPRRRQAPTKRATSKAGAKEPTNAARKSVAKSAAASVAKPAAVRRTRVVKAKPASKAVPTAAATVAAVVPDLVEPITVTATKAATASRRAARSLRQGVRSLAEDAGRRSSRQRRRSADVPATLGRQASRAVDATKKAATSRTAVVVGAAAMGLVTGLVVNLGRKVAMQAPSVMAGDWFEALKGEHQAALKLFDQLETAGVDEPVKRTFLLAQLQHALAKHAFTEENVVYPALREWGDKADADKLNHDHGYVKQHLYELDALDPRSSQFEVKLAAFRADLEAHVREEEQLIFPPFHDAMSEAKNKTITALANKEGFKLA